MEKRIDSGKLIPVDRKGRYLPEDNKLGPRSKKVIGIKPYPKYYELCGDIGVELNGKLLEKLLREYLEKETGYKF